MAGRECYHCKQWVEDEEAHDCWTTTEAALTADLTEDLREAWERLREAAVSFGEQRIYASHNSIMFSRKTCYFFVRPKRSCLEVCVFLGRAVAAPLVQKVIPSSKTKFAHLVRVRHRDEVEAPLTDWLQEAYAFQTAGTPAATRRPAATRDRGSRRGAATTKGTNKRPKKTIAQARATRSRARSSKRRSRRSPSR
jgi:hypothetical protein